MSNGLCACGLPAKRGHTHTTVPGPGGPTCSQCGEIIISPILATEDPRNETAPMPNKVYVKPPPLPVVLIDLWDKGEAPVAPYVEEIGAYCHPHNYAEWLAIFDPWQESELPIKDPKTVYVPKNEISDRWEPR